MKIACVMDPIESISVTRDTTFGWLLAAQARGHEIYMVETGALVADNDRAYCWAAPLRVRMPTDDDGSHFERGAAVYRPLADFDVAWMRRDPPFDTDYLFSTYILELAEESGQCWVLNHPRGLRDANEKAYILHFPEVIPDTLVARHGSRIKDFMASHGGRCIVKPLDGHGGEGIFMLTEDDLNTNSILETITHLERRYVMVQQYLPAARQGDKRIITIDGDPIGAIMRVPPSGELRGNIHVGGRVVATEITERERALCAHVAPRLARDGLAFVGIDVIGERMTEINVTSPTGIREMSELDHVDHSARWIAWIEENLASHQN